MIDFAPETQKSQVATWMSQLLAWRSWAFDLHMNPPAAHRMQCPFNEMKLALLPAPQAKHFWSNCVEREHQKYNVLKPKKEASTRQTGLVTYFEHNMVFVLMVRPQQWCSESIKMPQNFWGDVFASWSCGSKWMFHLSLLASNLRWLAFNLKQLAPSRNHAFGQKIIFPTAYFD